MTTTLLISEAKLREFTDINNNVDSSLLVNAIREAQDIELQRVLGTILYNKILSDVAGSTISGNYKDLLDNWIQDFLLYSAYYISLEYIYLRPRNNGLVKPTGGENSIDADLTLFDRKRQSTKNKKEFYGDRLVNHLIEDQVNFPEYTQGTNLDEMPADVGTQFRSPLVFRINTRADYLREMERRGIRVYDSRYPNFPQ
jgi:hypothetical protein